MAEPRTDAIKQAAKEQREKAAKIAQEQRDRLKLSPAQEEAQKQGQNEREEHAKKAKEDEFLEPSLLDPRTEQDLLPPDESTPLAFRRDADRRPGDPTPVDKVAYAKAQGIDIEDEIMSGVPDDQRRNRPEAEQLPAEGKPGVGSATPRGMKSSKSGG